MERQPRPSGTNPLGTALTTGLAWGILFGFMGGLLYLFVRLPRGSIAEAVKNLLLRLQAIAYTTVFFCLFFAVVLGMLGLLVWGICAATRRQVSQQAFFLLCLGCAIAVTVVALWSVRYTIPQVAGRPRWLLVLTGWGLGILLGGLISGGLYLIALLRQRDGKGGLLRWSTLRRWVLVIFLASVAWFLLVGLYRASLQNRPPFQARAGGQAATPERPNIILITIDTLRADHLGAYGYDPEISPHIDALAQQGVLFRQAFAQSSWTLQSVASFNTSLYPTELQVQCARGTSLCATQVDEMRTTVAEVMQASGYRTQAYLNNIWLLPQNGFAQGFDHVLSYSELQPYDLEFLRRQPLIQFLYHYLPRFQHIFEWVYDRLIDPSLAWENVGVVSDYGRHFLRAHHQERFFLWLYYMEPHTTYDPEKPFRPLPEEVGPGREAYLRGLEFWELGDIGPQVMTPADVRAMVSLYDGEIRSVDRLVGEVLEELALQGLTDRTLVVLLSDHGEEFNEHGGFTHGRALYQETLRVPLLFSGPMIVDPGRVVETPVQLLDLLPTLAEIAGAPIPAEARGHSLRPFLQGETLEERPAYSEGLLRSPFAPKAVIYRGYKLIYSPVLERVELFNLDQDPREQVNLAELEPAQVGELMTLLQAWMERAEKAAEDLPRAVPAQAIDEDTRRRLRGGGY